MYTEVYVQDILTFTPIQIRERFKGVLKLLYPGGEELTCCTRQLIFTSCFWPLYKEFPLLTPHPKHHLSNFLNGKHLNAATHIDMVSAFSSEIVLELGYSAYDELDRLQEIIYEITNEITDTLSVMASEYVMTLKVKDLIEITRDESVIELREKVKKSELSFEDFYGAANKKIMNDDKYKDNNIVQYQKMKIVNPTQMNQCVFSRGYAVEITGDILSIPIYNNYVSGISELYSYAADSRGAAIHFRSAEDPLKQSEFFAARLQKLTGVVEKIVRGDCGSTRYYEHYVKPPKNNEYGRRTYKGDLYFMRGKKYLCEETHVLKTIHEKDRHLNNKVIKLRSSHHCKIANPHHVCQTCFGDLFYNVGPHANIGHLSAATLTRQESQNMLGTKHIIASAVGIEFEISSDVARYIVFDRKNASYLLRKDVDLSKLKIIIDREQVKALTDVKLIKNSDKIPASRVSEVTEFFIVETLKNGQQLYTEVSLEQSKKGGYFSEEFINYIKKVGWKTDENHMFVFDLSGYHYRNPLLIIPEVQYDQLDHVNDVSSLIESKLNAYVIGKNKSKAKRKPQPTPDELLTKLFDLVNSKVELNMAMLEIIVYSTMTPSPTDYGLARNCPDPYVNIASKIIANRSLGVSYQYIEQKTAMLSPKSFFQLNRPDSVFDALICPREVAAAYGNER